MYLKNKWIEKDLPSLRMLEKNPHLLSINWEYPSYLDIFDWNKGGLIKTSIKDRIKNNPHRFREFLFVEIEGITRLKWNHDLLKLLVK